MNLIHQPRNEKKSAAVTGVEVLAHDRAGNPGRIETSSFVFHHDDQSPVGLAGARYTNFLARVQAIPVDYRIG